MHPGKSCTKGIRKPLKSKISPTVGYVMGLEASHCDEEMAQAFPSEGAPMLGILSFMFTSW